MTIHTIDSYTPDPDYYGWWKRENGFKVRLNPKEIPDNDQETKRVVQ